MLINVEVSPASILQHIQSLDLKEEFQLIQQIKRHQPEIDLLVTSYLMHTLSQLGIHKSELERYSDTNYCHQKLQEKQIPLSKVWWISLLAQIVNKYEYQETDEKALIEKLLVQMPFYHIELTLIQQVGNNLLKLMKDQSTSTIIQVLFADDLMTKWYESGVTYQVFYQYIQEALKLITSRMQKISLLEVGSGTGGLTTHLLPLFPEKKITKYMFTDISNYFLRIAKKKYAKFPFMEYNILDLEQDCLEQGYTEESFDIILANNVIHDTKNILFTLKNLQKLLKKNGFLILLELTAPQIWWHMCFGSLEGWWRFKMDEDDRRKDLMLLNKKQWVKILEEVGFSHTLTITNDMKEEFANCVFISQL